MIGEYINEYPDNQKIFESELRKYTALAIKEERKRNYLQSMKYLLQANSVLPDNNVDYLIESELNLAKLKTKTFPNINNYLVHYETLLNRFSINPKEEEAITYELLLSCYETPIEIGAQLYVSCAVRFETVNTVKPLAQILVLFRKIESVESNDITFLLFIVDNPVLGFAPAVLCVT